MASSLMNLQDKSLLQTKLYVNGEWVDSKSGSQFDVSDPSSGNKLITISNGQPEDYESAIQASHEAFKTFKKTTAVDRANLLKDLYEAMMSNTSDLARILSYENGKTIADSTEEIQLAAGFLRFFSQDPERLNGETIPSMFPNMRISTRHEPIGPCGLMTPWNYPIAMITRKLGAALAAGCTAVIKPSDDTPLNALAFAKLCENVGVPKGVVNILPTDGETTPKIGQYICEHPLIRKVSFTGSTRVGKVLQKQSADTLKKLSLELGGNAPYIVCEDANIDKAIEHLKGAKFVHNGQACISPNRIFVHEKVFDEFVSKVVKVAESFVSGKAYDEDKVTLGPLIHPRAVAKITELVKDAVDKGAKVETGGYALEDLGEAYYKPTVLTGITKDMLIRKEEIFGPVAAITKYTNLDEVLEISNETNVGLGGYVYTQDISRANKIAEALEVGMVGVNSVSLTEPAAPFGGVKHSGFGIECSSNAVYEWTVNKTILVDVEA